MSEVVTTRASFRQDLTANIYWKRIFYGYIVANGFITVHKNMSFLKISLIHLYFYYYSRLYYHISDDKDLQAYFMDVNYFALILKAQADILGNVLIFHLAKSCQELLAVVQYLLYRHKSAINLLI